MTHLLRRGYGVINKDMLRIILGSEWGSFLVLRGDWGGHGGSWSEPLSRLGEFTIEFECSAATGRGGTGGSQAKERRGEFFGLCSIIVFCQTGMYELEKNLD